MSVFAPILEEWLCRGVVLRGLLNYSRKGEPGEDGSRRGMNPALAIAISAIFFATIHGNLWQGISEGSSNQNLFIGNKKIWQYFYTVNINIIFAVLIRMSYGQGDSENYYQRRSGRYYFC